MGGERSLSHLIPSSFLPLGALSLCCINATTNCALYINGDQHTQAQGFLPIVSPRMLYIIHFFSSLFLRAGYDDDDYETGRGIRKKFKIKIRRTSHRASIPFRQFISYHNFLYFLFWFNNCKSPTI